MDHLDCYKYSEQILSGKIQSCKWVRNACERFERDLLNQDEFYFSEDAANHAISWFNFLHHVKGEWAKPPAKTISLELWQCFITANIFGWLRTKDDLRRYRTAYIEVARKNAKALSIFTKIPTPGNLMRPPGTFIKMRDIEVGDIVFDETESQCSVMHISDVMYDHKCYEVGFSDGAKIIADEGHLWKVESTRTTKPYGETHIGIRTTKEILETLSKWYHGVRTHGGAWFLQIISIKEVPSVPVKCIQVDSPSNLYLASESLIPTHNTTMAAGWGGYLFFADQEPGAEVYSVATTRDQAKLSFHVFQQMVKKSPFLSGKIKSFKNNLSVTDTFSKFEPLSADYNTLDGLSVHGGICDEVHAWPQRDLWEVCETATGARSQPLQIAITTAGIDQEGICKELHDYTEKLLANTIQDESFFGIIYTIDEKDKWHDENVWIKANPNLNVSVKLDDLQRKANKAKQIPAAINGFLTKHLDKWVSQASRWIDLDLWDANYSHPIVEGDLAGRLCVGGIDLSSVSDLTTWVMLFKNPDETLDILMRCWCPESTMYSKKNKYRSQYQSWEKQGCLLVTEGDAIDYDFVRSQVVKDSLKYNIDSISVDRLFQGYEFSMKLNDELGGSKSIPKVIACGMGYLSMAGPCQEFERLLLEKKLNHGMNPILRFMADSVAVSQDPAGNNKPNKDKSQGKIDGIVSILLGIDRLLRTTNVPYEPPMVA